jgi:Mg-chelatase subunit ChlI
MRPSMPDDKHVVTDREYSKEIFRDCSAAEIRAEIGKEEEALWMERVYARVPEGTGLEEVLTTDEVLDLLLDVLEETRRGVIGRRDTDAG